MFSNKQKHIRFILRRKPDPHSGCPNCGCNSGGKESSPVYPDTGLSRGPIRTPSQEEQAVNSARSWCENPLTRSRAKQSRPNVRETRRRRTDDTCPRRVNNPDRREKGGERRQLMRSTDLSVVGRHQSEKATPNIRPHGLEEQGSGGWASAKLVP